MLIFQTALCNNQGCNQKHFLKQKDVVDENTVGVGGLQNLRITIAVAQPRRQGGFREWLTQK